ncbi:hypothetical protein FRC04_005792 [Tulasnella sp. 424]|nr:hypothetical protein FRC04_005792 [Tulasnella sp. 424]
MSQASTTAPASGEEVPALVYRTLQNAFNVFREYPRKPLKIPDLGTSLEDLAFDAGSLDEEAIAGRLLETIKPFGNMSIYRIDFSTDDLPGAQTLEKLNTALDKLDEGDGWEEEGTVSVVGDGWIQESVRIEIPTGAKQATKSATHQTPPSVPFNVPGLFRHPLIEVIKAAFQDDLAQDFHFEPFRSYQACPGQPGTNAEETLCCLHDELYASDAWLSEQKNLDWDGGEDQGRTLGVCDPDGCDLNSYRQGDTTFYGPGKTVDTSKKITAITQFITNSGTATGTLTEIHHLYVQNGIVIQNSVNKIAGISAVNSITEAYCDAQKESSFDSWAQPEPIHKLFTPLYLRLFFISYVSLSGSEAAQTLMIKVFNKFAARSGGAQWMLQLGGATGSVCGQLGPVQFESEDQAVSDDQDDDFNIPPPSKSAANTINTISSSTSGALAGSNCSLGKRPKIERARIIAKVEEKRAAAAAAAAESPSGAAGSHSWVTGLPASSRDSMPVPINSQTSPRDAVECWSRLPRHPLFPCINPVCRS